MPKTYVTQSSKARMFVWAKPDSSCRSVSWDPWHGDGIGDGKNAKLHEFPNLARKNGGN
jgi:hypothetical protein